MITGGYYIKARCIQESEIAHAPPHVREIWDWLIKEANHSDIKINDKIIKRGQCIRSYKEIQEGLKWAIGYRTERYTKWQCENSMKWLTKHDMIATTKTTRGLIITICKYSLYQNPKNYECHNESHKSATRVPQTTDTINNNDNNVNKQKEINKEKVEFKKVRKLYPGTKRGFETEYENFKKKHKDWNKILPLLYKAILYKININKNTTGFVPDWANFQTWINQRRWEEEISKSQNKANDFSPNIEYIP